MYTVQATERPKWYNFRWRVSSALVRLARRIYPANPDVKAFFMQIAMDQMICGGSVVRVDPLAMKETGKK